MQIYIYGCESISAHAQTSSLARLLKHLFMSRVLACIPYRLFYFRRRAPSKQSKVKVDRSIGDRESLIVRAESAGRARDRVAFLSNGSRTMLNTCRRTSAKVLRQPRPMKIAGGGQEGREAMTIRVRDNRTKRGGRPNRFVGDTLPCLSSEIAAGMIDYFHLTDNIGWSFKCRVRAQVDDNR